MIENSLCQIGLTRKEVKIYLELVKIGAQANSIIARKVGLNRTTAYSILKSLEKKGMISSYNKNHTKYFTANDPNCLVGYLDRRCKTFDYYKTEMLTLIPKIRELNRGNLLDYSQPIISFYEGKDGVKFVMNDALKASSHFLTFVPLHKWFDLGLVEFLLDFRHTRVNEKNIVLKAIVPDTKEVRAFFNDNASSFKELTHISYISDPEFTKMFENQINIYDDKVSIIHLEKGLEYGVIIKSKQIADMQKAIFDIVWKSSVLK